MPNTSHHISSQPRQTGTPLHDSLVKIILLLLCGLLFANSVLFYKMWDLEAKLGNKHMDIWLCLLFYINQIIVMIPWIPLKPPKNFAKYKIANNQTSLNIRLA